MVDATPAPPLPGRAPAGGHYGLWLASRVLVSLLSLLVIIGSGVLWATFKSFTDHVPHGPAVPGLNGAADIDGAATDILLTGNDSRAGATPDELKALSTAQDGGSVNTDTMMVLHIPADGSRATIISFPRDSWVDIPGHGRGKINSAYGIGYTSAKNAGKSERDAEGAGLIMTIKTIDQLTGLHIDHYMQVDLLGFYRISNAIGGVTVCLNAAQNASTDSDAYGRGYSGINLPKGVSTIEGSQALAFVRQRHGLPRGDLDRIARQQYFLSAAFRKVETGGVLLNPFKLHRLLDAVGSSLLTDPKLDLLSLGREFAMMTDGNITYKTIPNNGPALIYPDGVETSIVDVNIAAIPAFVRDLDHSSGGSAYQSAKAAAPSQVTVDVLNGTDLVGLAGRNGDRLKSLGFVVDNVDSTDATTATTVEYPNGFEAQAKAVANAVHGAKVTETSSVTRVTLVLGTNGVQANGLAATAGGSSQPAPTHSAVPKAPTAGTLGCIN